MLVYLDHPKHGTHIAYSAEEVESCKRNGWVPREARKAEPAESAPEERKPRAYKRKAKASE